MKKILFFIAVLLFFGFISKGQTISVSGTPTFSALSVTEAGNNFTTTLASATNATLITIGSAGSNYWHVTVKRVDANWNTNLKVWVKRTGNGTGTNTPSGGTSYQEVTLIESTFFSGRRNRTSIPIQYQVSNISMTVPAASYTTTIYYTVYRD